MNLNTLARTIAAGEGKKRNVNIGQIKEILRLVLLELKGVSLKELAQLLNRVK